MLNVLLVDPNHRTRIRLEQMLDWKRWGFCVDTSLEDYTKADALIKQQTFSLILIHIQPNYSASLQLCQHIRQYSHMPIVLVGETADHRLLYRALAYQIGHCVSSPLDKDKLTSTLLRLKSDLAAGEASNTQQPSQHLHQMEFRKPSSNEIITIIKSYVQLEMHRNVTLKSISSLLHFNSAYLGQLFKQHENMSFNDYLLQQRMEHAKLLLAKTNLRIYQIANKVGYTEMDWFYKKFKEYTGASANEYRKQVSDSA